MTCRSIHLALACLSLILGTCEARATLVLVVRTDDEVFLAADSLEIEPDGRIGRVCKLNPIGGVVWAGAGLYRDNSGTFQLDRIARRAITPRRSLSEIGAHLKEGASRSLGKLLPRMKAAAPDLYKRTVRSGLISRAVVVKRTDVLEADIRVPDLASPSHIAVSLDRCPGNACDGDFTIWGLGIPTAVSRELGRWPSIWQELGMVDALRHLMKVQHDATPETVGEEVSILKTARDGTVTWLQEGACGKRPKRKPGPENMTLP